MKLFLLILGALFAAAVELIVIEVRSPRAHAWMEEESRGEVFILLAILSFALLMLLTW